MQSNTTLLLTLSERYSWTTCLSSRWFWTLICSLIVDYSVFSFFSREFKHSHGVKHTWSVAADLHTSHTFLYRLNVWMFFFSSYLLFFNSQSRMQEIKSLKLHIFQVKDPKLLLFLWVCLNSTASWRGVHNNLSTPMPVIQNSAVLDFMTLHMNLI